MPFSIQSPSFKFYVKSAQAGSTCVYVKPPKITQHMDGIIPYMFDCYADPVVQLLLLQISMPWVMETASVYGEYLAIH